LFASSLEKLSLADREKNFYLRRDRVLGAFSVDCSKSNTAPISAKYKVLMENERLDDRASARKLLREEMMRSSNLTRLKQYYQSTSDTSQDSYDESSHQPDTTTNHQPDTTTSPLVDETNNNNKYDSSMNFSGGDKGQRGHVLLRKGAKQSGSERGVTSPSQEASSDSSDAEPNTTDDHDSHQTPSL
jgi:hypothetical protein